MKVRAAFLPRDLRSTSGHVCVVVDVLRASSTLVTLLQLGAAPVYVAPSADTARALAARLSTRPLLCGEVGSLPPPGFDGGNSPTELATMPLLGRPVVLATSNGTRALDALAAAPAVLVGCFLNASAVATRAVALAGELDTDVALVCTGRGGGQAFAFEDVLGAGLLAHRMQAEPTSNHGVPALDDAALAAWRLYQSYGADRAPANVAAEGLQDAEHGRELVALGFAADVAYCARVDVTRVVPRLEREGDALILRDDPPH